jgi:hypothetical protein
MVTRAANPFPCFVVVIPSGCDEHPARNLQSFFVALFYFFAADKFWLIWSQFTTFHHASMYSGRRF